MARDTIVQFIKYGMVGILNTLITLGVILLCKSVFGIAPMLSNTIGYITGVVNSFIWNKTWVFRSGGNYSREAIKFVSGFGICYGIQFIIVWCLSYHSPLGNMQWDLPSGFVLSGYGVATILGNIIYTVANFIYNRIVTFR
ncbi:MAG: GtrA family protein [Muribaculaceae bacterium]|nr:GtrA family protein [Muribaculaceae bacterium]